MGINKIVILKNAENLIFSPRDEKSEINTF
jgi:hypothetical protein